MARAWDGLASAEEKIRHLVERIELNAEVDEILEGCMQDHCTLATSFSRVFAFLGTQLGVPAVFVHTIGENLSMEVFSLGVDVGILEKVGRDMLTATEMKTFVRTGLRWHVMPLDMAGEQIGTFGMALPSSDGRPEALVFDLMDAVAEELDQFFFAIQENRRKQLAIEAIQLALKNPILVQAVDEAVAVLQSSIPVTDLFLLYLDEDMEGRAQIQYIIYKDAQKAYDSVDRALPGLDRLLAEKGAAVLETGSGDLAAFMPEGGLSETKLIDGLVKTTLVGRMVLRPRDGSAFSLANREIIQIFTEALRQRMVDFNREKKALRKSFSPEVVRRLIRSPDYVEVYLSPRAREIAILYADISGFTKMCEQILRDPIRIGDFINGWSYGVVDCIYDHGGAFDKMVGDCIIGLFGPPFFADTPEALVQSAAKAAVAIRTFTREFMELPKNADVKAHPLYPDLGVATGVNFCPANVGFFGPDRAYTCFSSGMNNTARLQGLAKAGHILVMDNAKAILDTSGAAYAWEGPLATQVKNVAKPLQYFMLK